VRLVETDSQVHHRPSSQLAAGKVTRPLMHLITLATADGQVAQRSTTTAGQKTILAALKLGEPARFFDFTIPTD